MRQLSAFCMGIAMGTALGILAACVQIDSESYDTNASLICFVDDSAVCDGSINIFGECAENANVQGMFEFRRTYKGREVRCFATIEGDGG